MCGDVRLESPTVLFRPERPSRPERFFLGLVAVIGLLLATVHTADAQVDISDLGPSHAADIERVQRQANEATQRFAEAETELGELDSEIDRAASSLADTERRLEVHRQRLRANAVSQYVSAGSPAPSIFDEDVNLQVRANAMAEMVTQTETDALEDYRVATEDLEIQQAELDRLRDRQRELLVELETAQGELLGELDELRRLEAERQQEIDRREEEERQRQEEIRRQQEAEAARQAEQEEAARRATTTTTAPSRGGGSGGGGSGGGGNQSAPSTPIASGSWICPVQGPHSFVDSWGAPRSGGRRHRGVDMMAAIGVPVVAPVSGNVSHRSNPIGGLSFHLNGDDGHYYYGTHLSAYANQGAGWVEAGTVVGYVGDTGNARGIPHLHFEIHPNGGSAVNPTPTVAAACR